MPVPQTRLEVDPAELKRRRMLAGLDRSDLAIRSGISQGRIEQLEQGVKPGVLASTARALADELGCTVADIADVREVAV